MIKRFFILLLAIVASVGMSWAATVVTITTNDFPQYGKSFTKDGVTVSADYIDGDEGNLQGGGSFSTTLGNFTKIEVNARSVNVSGEGWSGFDNPTWTGNASSVSFSGDIMGMGMGVTTLKFTIEDAAPANSCGGGLTWELNNGELVISYDGEGTGVMNDYDIPNDNLAPWYANRENITSVSLPEGIKTIGKDAFRDCVNLTTVTIPNSVTTIGESAFVSVEHLETVTIGTGITSIVNGAFYGNAELTTVTCSATTPPAIGEMVFGGCSNLEHIYVPAASVDAYKTAWSAYASLISAAGGGSTTDPIVIATNTEQSSYTQGSITVSVNYVGDSDGFRLNDDNSASISNSGSSTISKIELVPGWFLNKHSYVRANGAEPNSSSEELITFLNVNSNEVTLSCSVSICIKEVRVYFGEAGGGSTDVIPCTAADLGKVLCTDGSIYATVSEAAAASKTAAAVIAYVDTENGKALALALADDGGEMEWAPAKTTAAAHTPAVSGGTWTLASKDDWNNMITAAGGYEALRDGFSAVGGTNMQQDAYWSSTPVDDLAWIFYFAYGGKWVDDHVDNPSHVRACLAFDIPAIPTNKLYMEVDGTAGTLKWGIAGSNPVYDGDVIQYDNRKDITTLTIDESCQNHTLTSFYNLFYSFSGLTTITGLENLATANVESMRYMFYNCKALTSLDLSSFNTAKVTDMKGMFNTCSTLSTIYVGDGWNTSAVTDGYAMFYGCTKLPNYDSEATGVEKAYVGAGGYLSAKLTPEAVVALIEAIGTVELTAECKAKIDAARAAYDGLSESDKDLVTNSATLTQAETDYAALAAAAAAPVIAQIEALPTTIKLSTYFSTYDLMVAARAAYNALSAEVQAAVTNLSKLTNLEAAFAAIGGANEKLSKPFSVGAGQVVYFSHGNLQATYNGTNWSWAFAAHQYDYIGDTSGNIIINGNGTLSGAGTVDLFGWVANSSTVLTSGVAKYGVSNSDNVIDYGLGETETLKGDWGVAANDANIGGYNDWRILSNDEWVYLFKTRTDAASKYGYATVGGVNGVIIIPDAFTDPMKNKGNLAFRPQNVDKGYSTNVYTTGGDWEAMEAAGAVFMPAAGRRAGTAVTINEGTGFYWSSTPMSYQASYFMGFMGSNVVPNNDRYRYHGLSVRLVSNNAPVASTPLDSALVVKDLIEAIPDPVTLDEACVKAIKDAREAYNKLSEAAKGLLDEATIAKLTDAEAALTALYQVEADKVIAKINNIPATIELKLATRDSIESARAAFEALNAEQKALVPAADLQKLTDAEAALAALNPGGGAPLPEGALTGAFSINADGDKIAFSKGNLQATYGGSDWTWAFAAHQYDVIGNAVANTAITGSGTVSENGTVDLFGWSTAATYYGINNTNVSGKHPGDFIDWGETIAEGWRTLTRDEWNYLFETRTDAASKYGHATVAGIHGIIVLPDSYKGTAINAEHSNWFDNTISAEDWAAYEANGVAFLPAAGSRLATSVSYVGEYAFYWTSTTYGEKWAYRVRFVPNLSPDYGDRVPGQSVRLVTAHTGGATPLDSAQAVKDLIEAIPAEITLDAACVNAVQAARDAYNALAEATKGALDAATVQKLNQAITDYTALIQAGADAVTAKINNIPQPVTLKLATGDSIQNARAAYDALTADQQALVTNYQTLLDAEAALAEKNPSGGMPAGALSGKFAINAEGDQIAFAKGNLQATYDGSDWTWGFAANQWNYLGIAVANSKINGNGTVSENGTVDLFGWSTAATYYGINNSYKAVDYIGDFVDWGPKMGAGWRTLTKDEWNYLIENNTKGRATVNDKSGYIFLPNDWSGPAFTPDPDNFTTNVYSGDDWTAMENAGAVFLPSGPARNGVYALIANDARYYSSTSLNNDSSYVFTIYYNQSQSACTGSNRAYGCMVRLVTEGGGATPLDSAQAVKDLIDAIPVPVSLADSCVNAIQAAREAYDKLSEATKGALNAETVKKLTDAEQALKDLNQAEANKVIAKINAIPQPVELKLATRDSIQNAREAFDALTPTQQALVTNYPVLTAAEATWAGLVNVAPAGALSGKYTINASGDVIYFAHGNLQYTRENLDADWSTGTFRLATNQYDLIEAVKTYPDAYCTDNYGDKTAVGLFGWGTWGEGKTPNLTSSDKTLYTWSTDFSGTLEGTNTWRTLTKDEWVYLLTNHNMTYATVHDVNGLLVAPDGKDIDGKSMEDWVVINDETWTTMQNDGYLFLPACGQRNQMSATAPITTGEQGEDVVYYSSTEKEDDANKAYNIWYKKGQAPAADDFSTKRQAFGVRLVSAGVNPLDQAQAVKDLIDAIPDTITLDAACVNAIKDARAGYDALDTDAKAILDASDVQKLTDAEQALKDLNQAEADKVIAKINNIPLPVELKLATRDSIENARAAFDALNAAQQALVSNYQTLLDAEAALAEKNKGGSTPMDIVWDGNTGIASVDPGNTSPAYEGMTVTVGNGSSFSTYQNRLYFTFYSQPNGGYIFANENGTNITKVVIESTTALTSTMTEVDRMGSGWVISNENKTATWTGNADSVSIWKGQSFTNYWVVDTITFTVNGVGATPLDSAQAVKDLIDAIPDTIVYPTSGPAIEAALNAFNELSDAAKGALDDADVQKLNDAATQYAALEAIAAIEAIPAEIVYDPAVKAAIETARDKYDALTDASKALVSAEVLHKLTNAEEAWAILVAKIEHNVSYIGKDGELKHETVALLHIPDPAPDFNGYEFVRWDVKAGDFLEEGLRIKAVYTPIITTNPVAYDTLVYNGTAQTLITAGVAKEGHIEYRLNDGEWSTELPKATMASANVVYYKLVREGHEDYLADSIVALIAKAPVVYTAPVAYDTLVYNAEPQTLIIAGQTQDGTFEYSLEPTLLDSWSTELPMGLAADTLDIYYRVLGDANHLDSTALVPVQTIIAKAPLKATADDKTVTYADAKPEYTLTYSGWQGEDTLDVLVGDIRFVCEYTDTTSVGEYAIFPYGVTAHDYAIDFVPGKLTVNKAALTITAEDKTRTYGDSIPEYTVTYSGFKNKDTADVVSGLQFFCEYKQTSNVGEYAIHPDSATAKNYAISFVDGKLTVSQAALKITADAKTVIYGDEIPTYTASYEGWKNTDDESVVSGLKFTCEYAPTSNVGKYVINPNSATATNYAITFVNDTLTVNQAPLMITADNKSVEYGEKAPAFTASYSGWKNNDSTNVVSGLTLNSAYLVTSNVGTYDIVADSAKAMNYAISYTKGTLTVNQAPLMITADNKSVEYGEKAPAFTASYSGWKNNDTTDVVSGLTLNSAYLVTSNVGTYDIVPSGATAMNYAISFTKGTLTVNQAPLMITADDKEVEYGEEHPEFTASYSGWKNNDTTDVVSGLNMTSSYLVTSNVGDYDIVPSGATAMNYAISFTKGTLTVNQAPLMITADDKSVEYGEKAPEFTASYSGWKNNDTTDVVSGLTLNSAYLVTSNVGTYDIVADSAKAMNYAISYTKGTLTVNQAPLTITANDTAMIYGDAAPEFTASYSGWKNADGPSVVSGLAYTTDYQIGKYVGTYTITPNSATAMNYAISFVDGKLTVNKATVYVSGAETHTAKFADGHANAEVTNQGTLNGIKLSDPIAHVTTATYSSADVAEHLTITLFYELTGDAALLNNYLLTPTSEIFTTEGVIIEPFIPNDEHKPEEGEQVEVKEGIDVYAYGYCDGSGYSLKYHLNSGNPDQYKIEFEDSRFTDLDWTNLTAAGKDGTIDIEIPVDVPTGDYSMTVYFRDSRFDWLESRALTVSFHVNLPETYVRPLFDNVIALVDTCNCLTDIQWYHRANSSEPWKAIPGANGYYYRTEGKLTGEYFVKAKMNGVETYTCGQSDMETLYGDTTKQKAQVKAYPNPVLDKTTVVIEGSTEWQHDLRIVNLMGNEMINTTFEGNETSVEMTGYPQGNYMISVDGIVVKVMKQ